MGVEGMKQSTKKASITSECAAWNNKGIECFLLLCLRLQKNKLKTKGRNWLLRVKSRGVTEVRLMIGCKVF